jgi:hypothetical protein
MTAIDQELAAYESMREDLETRHMGKWVLIRDSRLIQLYDSFESAAQDAVRQFGRGPYLIRQIGAPAITLPASVMYPLTHG